MDSFGGGGLYSVKRVRRHREPWYIPPPPPAVAAFACRGCKATLTALLRRLDDAAALCEKELAPLVPDGHYWQVAAGQMASSFDGLPVDFAGCFAVRPDALVGVAYHPDRGRLIGCCGPSGAHGPNRVCGCGRAVGTERSDCMWPIAVYLDPDAVCLIEPDAEPGAAADGGA
jgi:hypothetical protein